MGESRVLLGITLVLGIFLDVLFFSWTLQFWSATVHEVAVQQIAESEWHLKILWAVIDVLFAILVVGGIGILMAAALVYPAYYRLTGRR